MSRTFASRALVLLSVAALALSACSQPSENADDPPPPAAIAADVATVATPAADARVTSPLTVSGVAPAGWFFENSFPVRIIDAQGEEIAMAPATPRVNWTEPGDKEFDATLTFSVSTETPATIVLQEDMPGEGARPRETRVPVILTPAG
jgi:hypothetical protein